MRMQLRLRSVQPNWQKREVAQLREGAIAFVYSHPLSRLPVQQGIAYLLRNPLFAGINKKGQCTASVLDYRFRCQAMFELEWWMLQKNWELVQRNVKQSTVSPAATAADAGNSVDAGEEEQDDESDEGDNDSEVGKGRSGKKKPPSVSKTENATQ